MLCFSFLSSVLFSTASFIPPSQHSCWKREVWRSENSELKFSSCLLDSRVESRTWIGWKMHERDGGRHAITESSTDLVQVEKFSSTFPTDLQWVDEQKEGKIKTKRKITHTNVDTTSIDEWAPLFPLTWAWLEFSTEWVCSRAPCNTCSCCRDVELHECMEPTSSLKSTPTNTLSIARCSNVAIPSNIHLLSSSRHRRRIHIYSLSSECVCAATAEWDGTTTLCGIQSNVSDSRACATSTQSHHSIFEHKESRLCPKARVISFFSEKLYGRKI